MKITKLFIPTFMLLFLSLVFATKIKANGPSFTVVNIYSAAELQEALDNTTNDEVTLRLMNDIKGNLVCAIDENYQAKIDLNDHCITGSPDSEDSVITIHSGSLTIMDTSETKTRHYYEIVDGIATISKTENKEQYFDGGYIIGGIKGGGIAIKSKLYPSKKTSLKVENITIIGNSTGVLAKNDKNSSVEMYGSNIIGNNNKGLDIMAHLIMEDCKVLHNSGYAGAGIALLFANEKECVINDCIISYNHAQNRGGGLYIGDSSSIGTSMTLNNCIISNNTSGGGGGICFEASQNSKLLLKNCTIKNNIAEGGGGIVKMNDANSNTCILEMIGGSIEDNTSLDNQGGGVYVRQAYSLRFNDVLVKNNKGGGIYTLLGSLELTNTKITNNDSFGLFLYGSTKLLGTSEIINNYAMSGDDKTNCNVLLHKSGLIEFDDSYNSSSKIGISLENDLKPGTYITIVKRIPREDILERFICEDPKYVFAMQTIDNNTDMIIKLKDDSLVSTDPSGNTTEENNKPQNPSNPSGNNNKNGTEAQQTTTATTIADNDNTSNKTIDTNVKLKKVTNKKGRKLKLSYNMDRDHFEYDIQVATNKKFTKNVKIFNTVLTKGKDIKLAKKYKGKKVYVRVRANYDYNNKTEIKGKWSKVKSVKIKK